MKLKNFIVMLLPAVTFTVISRSQDGGSKPSKAGEQYYEQLLTSSNQADRDMLCARMYALLQSSNEDDWVTASRYFYQMKMNTTVDSLEKAEMLRFPEGIAIRNKEAQKIREAEGAKEKAREYQQWVTKFPSKKFGGDKTVYDFASFEVAIQYAKEDDVKRAMDYANKLETKNWKGEGYTGVAKLLLDKGYLQEAGQLLKKAIDNARDVMATLKNDSGTDPAVMGYPSYCSLYSAVLYRQKKYKEALEYASIAHARSNTIRADINNNYAMVLSALSKNKEAFDIGAEAAIAGVATPAMKEMIKTLYIKMNGSDKGYDAYFVAAKKTIIDKMLVNLSQKMIDLPSPNFILKDLDGNTVFLSDYKGKVVVLDFWSTWCIPCKASFPAMQMTVDKYKDNADVQFLFIHTWERDSSATAAARQYIKEMKYPFRVLMDMKDSVSGFNKVFRSFTLSSLPVKFVIDRNGRIRFRSNGFEGDNDMAVEKLTAMIELANKTK